MVTCPSYVSFPAADNPETKCPLEYHLVHVSCPFPCPFLGSVGVEVTALCGGLGLGPAWEQQIPDAFLLCHKFCGLTVGAGLNTNIGFLVMSFGFSDPGCLAIFLAALSFHPTLFLSFCDRSAHRYTCRCRGQLHLFLFPSHTGSPLIVRDLGGPYGPLFRTFCVSVSSYLT